MTKIDCSKARHHFCFENGGDFGFSFGDVALDLIPQSDTNLFVLDHVARGLLVHVGSTVGGG